MFKDFREILSTLPYVKNVREREKERGYDNVE